ncbi:hypothetical protein MWU38_02555 [Qipengyuania sp. S6317L1]|uniref:hypothetical protein n=1 Tax=Qipengyuania sp. S6317L1 TaxID=2926410 RepID=UPI001FF23FF0|nr:hypothetical protein [Qipengyuania sp. S6317L1]MCK0098254.1 hypothetical protein [Qipengyuania sp. S6317L1]
MALEVNEVITRHGSVMFDHGVEPRPASREVNGNVTINTDARPGIPSHFEVSRMITAHSELDGIKFSNTFHLNTVVAADGSDKEYYRIDAASVAHLPELLRKIADEVEKTSQKYSSSED